MGSASGAGLRGLRRTTRSTLYRAAFGKIVNALVEAVLMPLIAAAVGSPNFDSFAVLTEIRDLLAERRGGPTSGTTAL